MSELAKRADFDTGDPERLREDLRREHEELYAALVALERLVPSRWVPVFLADGDTIRAQRDQLIIGASGTVRPAGGAAVGDSFIVMRKQTSGTILIQADDGELVQGSTAGESWSGVVGWALFIYGGTEAGWLRQFI